MNQYLGEANSGGRFGFELKELGMMPYAHT
jgi:aldehyde:ferredoxin oxidoreductase